MSRRRVRKPSLLRKLRDGAAEGAETLLKGVWNFGTGNKDWARGGEPPPVSTREDTRWITHDIWDPLGLFGDIVWIVLLFPVFLWDVFSNWRRRSKQQKATRFQRARYGLFSCCLGCGGGAVVIVLLVVVAGMTLRGGDPDSDPGGSNIGIGDRIAGFVQSFSRDKVAESNYERIRGELAYWHVKDSREMSVSESASVLGSLFRAWRRFTVNTPDLAYSVEAYEEEELLNSGGTYVVRRWRFCEEFYVAWALALGEVRLGDQDLTTAAIVTDLNQQIEYLSKGFPDSRYARTQPEDIVPLLRSVATRIKTTPLSTRSSLYKRHRIDLDRIRAVYGYTHHRSQ